MGLADSITALEDARKQSKRIDATFELQSASGERVSVEMALRPTSALFTVRAAHESRGFGPANDLVTALDKLVAAYDWSYCAETLKVQGRGCPVKGTQLAALVDALLVATF